MRAYYTLLITILFLNSCEKLRLEDQVPSKTTHELQWIKLFGGSDEDQAHSVISTQDGGFAVVGNSKSVDGDLLGKARAVSDLLVLKYNAQYDLEWKQTYGGSGDDRGHSIVEMPLGGYAVLGYSMSDDGDASNNEGEHDNWVLRIDALGNLLWEKSYGFSGHDHAYNIISTQDGGLLFNGFLDVTASAGQGSSGDKSNKSGRHGVGEFWIHKIDTDGNIQWRHYFGGTNNDRSYDAVETASGDYVVVGTSESDDVDRSNSLGDYDVWVIKLDKTGRLLWEASFGGELEDRSNAVVLGENQEIYVFGNTFSQNLDVSSPLGSSDLWLLALDQNGNLLAEYTYGGSAFDLGRDLLVDQNNQLWLVGYGQSTDVDFDAHQGLNDVQLVQLNSQYQPAQRFSLGGTDLDVGNSIAELTSGAIIVVGTTTSKDVVFENNQGGEDVFMALWDVNSE